MARHWIAPRNGDLDVLEFVDVELFPPAAGEVTIEVRAAGVNPADFKHYTRAEPDQFPIPLGYEVAGVITAIGEGAELASGGGAVGDEVIAFRVRGGYATALNVPARDVFAKPPSLGFEEAANLLLAGTTAAEMLHVTGVSQGDTVLLHGASGAVGVSVLQQARAIGARVIGTASERNFDVVREFGGEPVVYGAGLAERLREMAPEGFDAALDAAGTDEAIDISLEFVRDRDRIVTIVVAPRAQRDGFRAIAGALPASAAFRDSVRAELIARAGRGELVVPMGRTYPLAEADAALEFLKEGHPGGKIALLP